MFRDFRTQLLLWTILPLALILIAYIGVTGHQNAMRNMVYDRDAALARVVAAQWSDALASHASLLPILDPAESSKCDTACAIFDGGIAFFDLQGNIVSGQPSAEVWITRTAQVKALIAQRDATFSIPFLEGGNPRIMVMNRRVDGFLVGAFTPPSLANLGFGARL
jgi:hypothetical protein